MRAGGKRNKFIKTRVFQTVVRFPGGGGDTVMGQQMCSLCSTKGGEEEERTEGREEEEEEGCACCPVRITDDDVFHCSRPKKLHSVEDSRTHALSPARTHATPPKHFLFPSNRRTPPRSPAASTKIPDTPAGRERRGGSLFSWPNSTLPCVF